jgi:hypothetical protein
VVQSTLVLVFFIVVPKVPNGRVLSFVPQSLLLDALMGMISIVYGSPAAGSGNKRAASIGGLGR